MEQSTTTGKVKVAVIGPGNIGSDLMYKVMRSRHLEMVLMAGIVESAGIQRARSLGIKTSLDGVRFRRVRREHQDRVRRHQRPGAPGFCPASQASRQADPRPHPRGGRTLRRAQRQPGCREGRTEPQHGHLRWPGHDAHRRRRPPGGRSQLRRDGVVASRPSPPGPGTRQNIDEFTADHGEGARQRSAGRRWARRSSS